MIFICCVAFAWYHGLYHLYDKCVYVFVLKALLISSATVIVRAGGGGHLVEPLCYGVVYLLCVVPSL